MSQSELRKLPGVDTLLNELSPVDDLPSELLKRIIRSELAQVRDRVKQGADCPSTDTIKSRVLDRCQSLRANRIRPVINATGVVLHTNLGRAPYPSEAVDDSGAVTGGYSNLEMDLSTGDRGGRGAYAEALLSEVTGGEEAAVVNNCSAALVLTLKCLTEEQDVLISRGELVQIGGGFRIPEILEVSGANLREVGTTNRTELSDFREALDDDVGMILQVHRSNFDQVGFTESPDLESLRGLADEADVPLVSDLGSGALVDTEQYGLRHERQPGEVLEDGADLVMFSGDKLLGGPQAGLIVGETSYVDSLKNHPMFRALRVGKSILTGLESVLTMYATDRADQLPVYRMFSVDQAELEQRANAIIDDLGSPNNLSVETMEGTVGGGALPAESIPSAGLEIHTDDPASVMEQLRTGSPPIVGRIKDGHVYLNLRTVFPEQDDEVTETLRGVLGDSS